MAEPCEEHVRTVSEKLGIEEKEAFAMLSFYSFIDGRPADDASIIDMILENNTGLNEVLLVS